ncbi:hypothetical protein [Nonomuraea dietziae]|uniref:hypothetical protein n=1 Tax=Nonomuraea dietziae TaxID=65515 RepID=UPI0031DF0FA6
MRRGDASAVVSAGSTGGVVATGKLRLKTQQSVISARSPPSPCHQAHAHSSSMLTRARNAEVKPEMLVQSRICGSAYAETAYGLETPRVGLTHDRSEAREGQTSS